MGFSLVASGVYSLVAVHRLLITVASLVADHGLQGPQASAAVAQGFSCSAAFGLFLGQGLNPCLPHSQADSLPLGHQGSPSILFNLSLYL